jgi:hypothetical protein
MPSQAANAIAYVGAAVGLIGGGVALFNSWKAVCWKRAELANNYLKDFNNNPELVFAGRCLDWNGGKLILPESLRPYMPDGESIINHDRILFAEALRPDLQIKEMALPRCKCIRSIAILCGRHSRRWVLGGEDTERDMSPSLYYWVRLPRKH